MCVRERESLAYHVYLLLSYVYSWTGMYVCVRERESLADYVSIAVIAGLACVCVFYCYRAVRRTMRR